MPWRYSPSTITGSTICSARARRATTPGSSSAAADKALVSRIIFQKISFRKSVSENQFQKISSKKSFPRESLPDFPIDLLERFFHPLFDSRSLLMQVFELPHVLHPGFFLGGNFQFLLDRFGDELAQGNSALGGG